MVSAPSMPAEPPDSPEPAPRGHDRDAQLRTDPHELGDLLGGRRQGDGSRQPCRQVGGLVVAVALAIDLVGQQPEAGQRALESRRPGDPTPACGSVGASRAESSGRRRSVAARYDGRDGSRPHARCRCHAGRCPRRTPLACPSVAGRRGPVRGDPRRSPMAAITPGSVDRSSLDARRDLPGDPQARPGRRRAIWVDSTATVRNTSGGPIDRLELNTIAARLGNIRLRPVDRRRGDGRGHDQRPDDRRAARRRSWRRVRLDPRAGPIQRTPADRVGRIGLAVRPGQRHRRHLPLAAMGQPADRRSTGRTMATRSRRRPARPSGSRS